MMRRISITVLAVALASAPLAALTLEPLRGNGKMLQWSGPQFVQADAHGNVFLLRGDTLQVYPVLKTHELGEPERLATTVSSGPLLDAAMSAHGDWALVLGSEVHYFAGGEEKPVPALPWFPAAVGFVRGSPAVLVVPPRIGTAGKEDEGPPPVLLTAGHDAWAPEVREALHGAASDQNNEMLFRAARVLDAREGRYVLARQYAYRIELRRTGRARPLGELRVGKGRPLGSRSAEEDTRRLLAQARAEGSDLSHAKASAFHGSFAILALAQGGPGGKLYVLDGAGVSGDRCALDRIDWEAQRVERTTLDMPCNGQASLAAGRDGLYLAKFSGQAGRYFAPWAAVERGPWAPVKGAEFAP